MQKINTEANNTVLKKKDPLFMMNVNIGHIKDETEFNKLRCVAAFPLLVAPYIL